MDNVEKASRSRVIFARNLRRVRRMAEYSQEALSLMAGLSLTYVAEVEKGKRNISIDNMDKLATALRVPLHDLVDPEKFKGLD